MNKDQLAGLFRAILAGLGGFLAGKGIDLGVDFQELGGALAILVTAVWSWFSKKPKAVVE